MIAFTQMHMQSSIHGLFASLKHTHITGCSRVIVPNNADVYKSLPFLPTGIGNDYHPKFWDNTLDMPILIGWLAWNEIRCRFFGISDNTKQSSGFCGFAAFSGN